MDVIFPYLHGFPSFPTHATHSKHIPNFVTRIVYKSVVSKREGFENGALTFLQTKSLHH